MASLKGDRVAMSITINSFAGGLSGKLQNGDIVSIYVTDKDNHTEVPASLKYVKVITTTTSGGIDENDVVENEDGSFELPTTITVLVSVEQAKILVVIQNNIGNKHSTTLIVATITSKSKKKREMPTHIVVNVDGLAKESIIQLEQITTVDKQQVLEFIGAIPLEIMEQVDKAIKISLALD